MRLVIELKRGGDPLQVVLNQLYKRTAMQQAFGINMVALVDGVPKTLSLRELVEQYVGHQKEVITRRTQHQLARAEARAHILEGLLVALDKLDAVIRLIRRSKDPDTAREGLIEKFKLTRAQAQAILDMRLQRLTALEADRIKTEHKELTKLIKELRAILADEKKVLALVKTELSEIAERYGDERRTEITASEGELDIEDVIADQQMVVSITASGYAKRTPLATYRQQRRGGRGVMGMNMKEGDYIEHLHVCSTHDHLLFFTNQGKVYRLKVYELPEGTRASRGRALVNVLPLKDKERVMSVIPTRDFSEGKFLVFGTAQGMVKKTPFKDYDTPIRADGIIAIKIRKGDELVRVRMSSGKDDIIMVSKSGHATRFNEKQARPMGRGTAGVKGNERLRQGERGALPRHRQRQGFEGRAPRRHRERLRQANPALGVPGQGPRGEGRPDGEADREEGRSRGRSRRPRRAGAALYLAERDGAAERRLRDLPDGAPDAGSAADEPEEGRPGERRRARRGVHRAERERRGRHRGARRGGGADGRERRGGGGRRRGGRGRRGQGDQGEADPEVEAAKPAKGGQLKQAEAPAKPKPAFKKAAPLEAEVEAGREAEAQAAGREAEAQAGASKSGGSRPKIKPKPTATAKQRARAEAQRKRGKKSPGR